MAVIRWRMSKTPDKQAQEAQHMAQLDYAVEVAKGIGALAKKIGVAQPVVSNWRLRKRVPPGWLKFLASKYKLKGKNEKPN